MANFLHHHGLATGETENPGVASELKRLQKLQGAFPGYISVRELVLASAVGGVVGRALLSQLVVPDMEEFAESLVTMFSALQVCYDGRSCYLLDMMRW